MKGARQLIPSPIRLPQDLKEWLKEKAEGNFRSMNSEVVARLEESRKKEEQGYANTNP